MGELKGNLHNKTVGLQGGCFCTRFYQAFFSIYQTQTSPTPYCFQVFGSKSLCIALIALLYCCLGQVQRHQVPLFSQVLQRFLQNLLFLCGGAPTGSQFCWSLMYLVLCRHILTDRSSPKGFKSTERRDLISPQMGSRSTKGRILI